MAISININSNNSVSSYSNEIIARRFESQTPLDFALTYLERIEDMFKFYRQFKIEQYNDFYDVQEYRITNYINPLSKEGYIAATKTDYLELFPSDFNSDWSDDFF